MSGWLGFRKGEGAGRARDGAFLYPALLVRVTRMTQATIQPPQDKLLKSRGNHQPPKQSATVEERGSEKEG